MLNIKYLARIYFLAFFKRVISYFLTKYNDMIAFLSKTSGNIVK